MNDLRIGNLRIGNLIQVDDITRVVLSIDKDGVLVEPLGEYVHLIDMDGMYDLQPIPLTEEWLLKFGFTSSNGWFELRCNKSFYSLDVNVLMEVSICVNNESMEYPLYLDHIKHVHQLQNLYYALTGEELTLR
jgi:hypothetical protein